jgi:PAS domain S-box-containing protein
LLGDVATPMAAFTADGDLIHATDSAADLMGGLTTLASLGAGVLAGDALARGHAEGRTPLGVVRLDRIGRSQTTVLLTTFPQPAARPAAAEPRAPAPAPVPPPAVPAADDAFAIVPPAPPQPPATPAPEATVEEDKPPLAERPPERRHPLRFVWQMDSEGRFTVTSDAFVVLIGPESASVLGQPWIDIAAKRGLDPDGQVEHAVDSRQTWSGLTVQWPVDGSDERLAVELSGLPMFDRDRTFRGYRGFGVCRDAERFAGLPRRSQQASAAPPQPLNVVPFRSAPSTESKAPALSAGERSAFRELARQLSARLKGDEAEAPPETEAAPVEAVQPGTPAPTAPVTLPRPADHGQQAAAQLAAQPAETPPRADGAREILERLPVGVLVYRINTPLYANRAFLAWSGHASLDAFITDGGLDGLFLESGITVDREDNTRLTLVTDAAHGLAASRLFSIRWDDEPSHALVVVPADPARQATENALKRAEAELREVTSLVELTSDGIVMVDGTGTILSLNRGAEALFGGTASDLVGHPFVSLLAPESRTAAAADLEALTAAGDSAHAGREVTGRMSDGGGSAALFMTLGRLASEKPTYCAVFRDIGRWKRSEEDLLKAKRQAEQASRAKSDFLAKISHEIRTPLNAIIGFSEVMMQERLGPIGNERYRTYLKDIRESGEHLIALLNDLLDLSKIEAGKLELTLANVDLNAETQQCVALMQPLANSSRVIMRTSLAPGLVPILADRRSVRQILLNLLSNSIKFTGVGGQVIVSTTSTDRGEAMLRVRDTGIGMTEKEIETALEPFRQIETSTHGASGGTGLGLPLTKALVEANRASFKITSAPHSGTLVEIAFATFRAPAQ